MSLTDGQDNEDDSTLDAQNPQNMKGISRSISDTTSGGEVITEQDNDLCNLIVNYLPYEFDENDLQILFEEYGKIVERKVVRDHHSKKSVGYGFVKYSTHEEALNAIKHRNGYVAGQKTLKVSFARIPSEDIKNCKLYVSNIPRDFSKEDCLNLFSQYGEIIECRVVCTSMNGGTSPKIVAFIQFNLRSQAEKALSSLDGYSMPGQRRGLSVKFTDNHRKSEHSQKVVIGGTPHDHQHHQSRRRSQSESANLPQSTILEHIADQGSSYDQQYDLLSRSIHDNLSRSISLPSSVVFGGYQSVPYQGVYTHSREFPQVQSYSMPSIPTAYYQQYIQAYQQIPLESNTAAPLYHMITPTQVPSSYSNESLSLTYPNYEDQINRSNHGKDYQTNWSIPEEVPQTRFTPRQYGNRLATTKGKYPSDKVKFV